MFDVTIIYGADIDNVDEANGTLDAIDIDASVVGVRLDNGHIVLIPFTLVRSITFHVR